MRLNLITIEADAQAASGDAVELDVWREAMEPATVLKLLEVARAALALDSCCSLSGDAMARLDLHRALRGVEAVEPHQPAEGPDDGG